MQAVRHPQFPPAQRSEPTLNQACFPAPRSLQVNNLTRWGVPRCCGELGKPEGQCLAIGKHRVRSLILKQDHNRVPKLDANSLTNEALQVPKLAPSLTVGDPILAPARYRSKFCCTLFGRRAALKPTLKCSCLARNTPVCRFDYIFHRMLGLPQLCVLSALPLQGTHFAAVVRALYRSSL